MNPELQITIIVVCGLFVYFMPSMYAIGTKHGMAIFMLNLFLGWTVLGWIGALIWAFLSPNNKIENK